MSKLSESSDSSDTSASSGIHEDVEPGPLEAPIRFFRAGDMTSDAMLELLHIYMIQVHQYSPYDNPIVKLIAYIFNKRGSFTYIGTTLRDAIYIEFTLGEKSYVVEGHMLYDEHRTKEIDMYVYKNIEDALDALTI